MGDRLDRWSGLATTFGPPVTLLTALLFYFGYVFSRTQYAYFGLDVDTVGLSTRDWVMRSPQALLLPLLILALGGAVLLLVHVAVGDRDLPAALVRTGAILGAVLLVAGLVLLFGYPALGDWPPYPLITPLLIASGTALVAYAARWPGAPGSLARGGDSRHGMHRGALALALVVIATCLFWATTTVAQWSGRGAAHRIARNLDELPLVILDTRERLYLTDGIVRESALPAAEGQQFRYRYRGLRVLLQGDGRMFLVPERWQPSNSTLMVPLDGSVRLQFRFVNDPP